MFFRRPSQHVVPLTGYEICSEQIKRKIFPVHRCLYTNPPLSHKNPVNHVINEICFVSCHSCRPLGRNESPRSLRLCVRIPNQIVVSSCVLRLVGFHVGTFRSKIPQACQNHSTSHPVLNPMWDFTSERCDDRTVSEGSSTPRAEAVRVHRALGRTTTAGPNNNRRDEQQSTAKARVNRPRTTNRPVKDKQPGYCQNRMSAVPFTLLIRMTCMVGPTGNVILEPGNCNVSNLF